MVIYLVIWRRETEEAPPHCSVSGGGRRNEQIKVAVSRPDAQWGCLRSSHAETHRWVVPIYNINRSWKSLRLEAEHTARTGEYRISRTNQLSGRSGDFSLNEGHSVMTTRLGSRPLVAFVTPFKCSNFLLEAFLEISVISICLTDCLKVTGYNSQVRNAYKMSVRETEGKKLRGWPRRRWEDNINTEF
jgi:hypothetical protein